MPATRITPTSTGATEAASTSQTQQPAQGPAGRQPAPRRPMGGNVSALIANLERNNAAAGNGAGAAPRQPSSRLSMPVRPQPAPVLGTVGTPTTRTSSAVPAATTTTTTTTATTATVAATVATPTASPLTTALATPSPDRAPETSQARVQLPEHLSVKDTKQGMDKQWFCEDGAKVGWLQPRNPSTAAALKRERETIATLADLGVPVGKVIAGPAPTSLSAGGQTVGVDATSGMWMEKVDSLASRKPKTLAATGPDEGKIKADKLAGSLAGAGVDMASLHASLGALIDKLPVLSPHVGEVDIHFTQDGKVVLLDVAPNESNERLGKDKDDVALVRQGMTLMQEAVARRLPSA